MSSLYLKMSIFWCKVNNFYKINKEVVKIALESDWNDTFSSPFSSIQPTLSGTWDKNPSLILSSSKQFVWFPWVSSPHLDHSNLKSNGAMCWVWCPIRNVTSRGHELCRHINFFASFGHQQNTKYATRDVSTPWCWCWSGNLGTFISFFPSDFWPEATRGRAVAVLIRSLLSYPNKNLLIKQANNNIFYHIFASILVLNVTLISERLNF